MDKFFQEINFPYENTRKGQDIFIKEVYSACKLKNNILVSAPTGLGKTVSGLAPALYYAKKNEKTVICLTSRQTQANQYIKTLKEIQQKSNETLSYVAFIGKRSMCVHEDKEHQQPQDFLDFCKKLRLTGKCGNYKNTKNEDLDHIKKEIFKKSSKDFCSVEEFIELSKNTYPDKDLVSDKKQSTCGFCPYYLAEQKAFKTDVIICDYNYLFQRGMLETFLGKIGRGLDDCIIIVDEAHNLPDRIRKSHSYTLSTELIRFSLQELKDHIKSEKYDKYVDTLRQSLEEIYMTKTQNNIQEYLVTKKNFLDVYLSHHKEKLEDIIEKLRVASALILEEKITSHISRIANFLELWESLDEDSYLRIVEKQTRQGKPILQIKIECLDPSEISGDIIKEAHSAILMSGTLSPLTMYKDILGLGECTLLELDSPFEKDQQLVLVEENVTSRYAVRTDDMYKKIANYIQSYLNSLLEKNAIIFFPSYDFMEKVSANIPLHLLQRKVLKEQRYMSKEKKEEYIKEFKGFSQRSKVLLAVTSGSFAEGVDLPKEALELVIVVGLPLGVPDLYTQGVMRIYDKKFAKGQLYGYVQPAMNKIIQAAGRCIRTIDDKGVIILMDNRFMWPLYKNIFPKHYHLQKATGDTEKKIKEFFN